MSNYRFQKLREQSKLSYAELGETLGFPADKISRIEKGQEPHADYIIKFADKFGVTTDYLLGRATRQKAIEWGRK